MKPTMEMVALELLEVVPPIMSTIKMKWKNGTIDGVSNLQFKIMAYLQKMPGASLQAVAHERGLPIATIAAALEELLSRKLVLPDASSDDLQNKSYRLGDDGQKTLQKIYAKSRTDLEEHISVLTADERSTIYSALHLMGPLFSINKEADENIDIQKELWEAHG